MKMTLKTWINARFGALLGLLVYLAQLIYYAITQLSVLDEGGYLYAGYLMVLGKLRAFQDYGVYSYNMPLAFSIPSFVQGVFGPGIRSGRIFSVVLAIGTAVTLWRVVRRLTNERIAAVVIWILPLSPLLAKIYSQAVTQGPTTTLLVLILLLVLGQNRSRWQIVVGGMLTGFVILLRLNMAPLMIFILLYLWWARDFKTAAYFSLASATVLLIIHGLYFPNILRLWAFWLPTSIFTFLEPFAEPAFDLGSWIAPDNLWTSLSSILFAIRYHTLTILAVVVGLILWPKKATWRNEADYKIGVFLAVSWVFMFFLHLIVTSFGTHCVFCLNSYMPFFSPLAFLLFALVLFQLPQLDLAQKTRKFRISGLITLMGAGLVVYPVLSKYVIGDKTVRGILNLTMPIGGGIPLWGLLENALALDYKQAALWVDRAASLGSGVLMGVVTWLGLVWLTKLRKTPINVKFELHPAANILIHMVLILAIFSPTILYSGAAYSQDCTGNSIAGYEQVGAELAEIIPPGSHIYWEGGRSPIVMLYLPDRTMSPAQMFNAYTFKFGGDRDELLRYGYYNEEMASEWIREADYILVEEDLYRRWTQAELEGDPGFNQIGITSQTLACMPNSQILVYQYQP